LVRVTNYLWEIKMYAAVVNRFDAPPTYQEFADPIVAGSDDALVDVVAVGLHPRVRSQANGSHYTSTDELPLIPGVDGVGRLRDGADSGRDGGLVYFVLPDTTRGSMAEQVVIDRRRSIALPDDADPLTLAAAMNPAMSSWVALRRRVSLQPGQTVFILGATGNAGRLAIQVARHLGAGRVVAAGRGDAVLATLPGLGADEVVSLVGEPEAVATRLREATGDVDVVLDYLWGQPAQDALMPILLGRAERSKALDWIQIGSVAGATIALPSAALRSANLRIMGSGQGSVSAAGILAELPALVAEIDAGTFHIEVEAVPLSDVETVWGAQPDGGRRTVITP
jgi:NADPH:quinone reductase-like Zn-dependent oxidoreductase